MGTRFIPAVSVAVALSLLAWVVPPAAAQPVAAARATHLQVDTEGFTTAEATTLTRALQEAWDQAPGGVVAGLWVPGRGYWSASIGEANRATGAPIRTSMQLPVGSVTKTFVGTLALKQIEKGRLRLTDTISRWFPSFPKADQITVAMLLNMTSGIADYVNGNLVDILRQLARKPATRTTPARQIQAAAKMTRVFDEPGSQYAYSNTNTVMLGVILEKLTGKSLRRLLQAELLRPLKLKRTDLAVAPGSLKAPHAEMYSDLARQVLGRAEVVKVTNWSRSVLWAAGGMASTLSDLRKWATALGTGQGVLKASTQTLRGEHCAPGASGGGYTQRYCLGVVIRTEDATGDQVILWHNGRTPGAASYLGYFPRTGASLVVLVNNDVEPREGEGHIADLLSRAIQQEAPELLGLSPAR